MKSYSQQMPLEDMEIISAFFYGSVIREGFGKIAIVFASIKVALPLLTIDLLLLLTDIGQHGAK
jgi:hypothetical protein